MSTAANKALVERYLEALSGNAKTDELVRQYVTNAELINHIREAEAGFPRYELVTEDLVVEGDAVAVRARMRGKHTGTFMGIPATGKTIDVPAAVFYRIENGKISGFSLVVDSMVMMQQLGVLPAS